MPDWTQAGMFWATAALCFISVAAVVVNYFVLRSISDPNVIVYAKSDEARPQMIMVVIQNVGKGVAKNVQFTLPEPLPVHQSGGGPYAPLTQGPLINGIPALAPGESRVFFWGMYLGLRPLIGDQVFTVTARFEGDRIGWFHSEVFEVENFLEVASYHGVDAVDTDGGRQSAEQLERIADLLQRHLK